MRKLLTIAAVVLSVTLIAAPSPAQVVATDAYQVNYFTKFGVFDFVRIINTGQIGSPIDAGTNHGTVCADIYVFDANQEMMTCCSCPITANGMLPFPGVLLVGEALTGFPAAENGVVKIVADRENDLRSAYDYLAGK